MSKISMTRRTQKIVGLKSQSLTLSLATVFGELITLHVATWALCIVQARQKVKTRGEGQKG
jgi:hypothetical protein